MNIEHQIRLLQGSQATPYEDTQPEEKYPWRGFLWIAVALFGAAVIAAPAVWWFG